MTQICQKGYGGGDKSKKSVALVLVCLTFAIAFSLIQVNQVDATTDYYHYSPPILSNSYWSLNCTLDQNSKLYGNFSAPRAMIFFICNTTEFEKFRASPSTFLNFVSGGTVLDVYDYIQAYTENANYNFTLTVPYYDTWHVVVYALYSGIPGLNLYVYTPPPSGGGSNNGTVSPILIIVVVAIVVIAIIIVLKVASGHEKKYRPKKHQHLTRRQRIERARKMLEEHKEN